MNKGVSMEEALEEVEKLCSRWGISSDEWCFVGIPAVRLQGYDVPETFDVSKSQIGIGILKSALPWDTTHVKFFTIPPGF
ncbi:MAG: hypothetical protein QME61_00400 [Patescibacteria group bacterium]|nr:hypothetical protein [Patescibacteria group bacterium]